MAIRRSPRPSPNHVWITTCAVYDADGTKIHEEGYWYEGPIAQAVAMNHGLVQDHFRVRTDTNTPNGGTPTWAQDEDVNHTIDLDTTFRVRFVVSCTGGTNFNDDLRLYYAINTGGGFGSFAAVDSSTTPVQFDTAASTVDAATGFSVTTANFLLTAGTGTSTDGVYDEQQPITDSGGSNVVIQDGRYAEIEVGLSLDSANMNGGDIVQLRLYDGNGGSPQAFTADAGSYTNTPEITAAITVKTASGNPNLTALTASGTADTLNKANGTPQLTQLTASGTATSFGFKTASGNATLDALTASGTASQILKPSGAATLEQLTASGTAATVLPALGNATLDALTASGTASQILKPSGAATLEQLTASGTVTTIVTASGNATLDALTASGTASQILKPSGAATLEQLTASGTATKVTNVKTASGNPNLTQLTASGTATNILTASGNPQLAPLTASGTATNILTASGNPQLAPLTASGTAVLVPKVWLNSTATLSGATEMTVTAFNAAGTSITFTDPSGPPTGSLWLGVESRNKGGGELNTGWIAVTVNATGIKPASGNPVLDTLTASGQASQILKPSGTPSIATITASGSAVTIVIASGNPSIDVLTASGSASQILKPSGTPSLETLTASGTAAIVGQAKTASGNPVLEELTASGTATVIITATGAATLDEITASGQAGLFQSASGTPVLDALTASGQAGLFQSASGTPVLDALTASGLAKIHLKASGTPSIDQLTASGQAGRILEATGAATLTEITASGIASKGGERIANGNPVLDAVTATGAASQILKPSGAATLDQLTASGTATIIVTASGNPSIDQVTAAGEAGKFLAATGAATLDQVTAAGEAGKFLTASGTPLLDALTATGTAKLLLKASGTPSLETLTASGTATLVGEAKTASGNPVLDTLTASGQAGRILDATGAATLEQLTASGSASQILKPSGAATLEQLTASGTAVTIVTATGAATLEQLTASGTAVTIVTASGTPTLAEFTASGSAQLSTKAFGTPSIDALTASGVATRIRTLTASGTPSIEELTSTGVVFKSGFLQAFGAATLEEIYARGLGPRVYFERKVIVPPYNNTTYISCRDYIASIECRRTTTEIPSTCPSMEYPPDIPRTKSCAIDKRLRPIETRLHMQPLVASGVATIVAVQPATVVFQTDWEGSQGQNSIVEKSSNAATVTSGGGSNIDTARAQFGSSSGFSGLFEGDWSAPNLSAYNLAGDNWSIESFINLRQLPSNDGVDEWTIVNLWGSGGNAYAINFIRTGGVFTMRVRLGGTTNDVGVTNTTVTGSSSAPGTWYHTVVERIGNTVYVGFNGFIEGSFAYAGSVPSSTEPLRLQDGNSFGWSTAMWHDETRIGTGGVFYGLDSGSTYTVPTATLPDP
jgi:hypothetical protein